MENKRIKDAIHQLTCNFKGDSWLDEYFIKKLQHVTEDSAFIRPIPELHSVAELIGHLLIWRSEGIKKLQGKAPTITSNSPENWRTNEELKKIGWQKLKSDFHDSQHALIELLQDKSDSFLEDNDYVPGYSYKYVLDGLIQHDIYHLGQIGLTTKLLAIHA